MNGSEQEQVAFVQEIARNQARLRAFVRCLMVRSSDVDDLLQEVNAVIWEKADDFEPGTDFWSWASQVARYKVLNQLRRYSREKLVFDAEMLGEVAERADRKTAEFDNRREALLGCLNKLPPAKRQLIDLRYVDGQAIERIAGSLGRPEGSIRQTLYRIRNALLECISEQLAKEGTE